MNVKEANRRCEQGIKIKYGFGYKQIYIQILFESQVVTPHPQHTFLITVNVFELNVNERVVDKGVPEVNCRRYKQLYLLVEVGKQKALQAFQLSGH